jgi:arylsulfatase A-like enzyme/thioredoxin-like negative regulator of GroEL
VPSKPRKPRHEPASPAGAQSRPRRRTLAAAIAAALLLAGAFALLRPRPQARREAGLNVLLITVDTLRADSVGAYGNARAQTPWMDRLAAAGVRFERAYAHNVVTLPSHANILSGLTPPRHGIRDNGGFRFPADRDTLATLLARAGYRAGAFVSAFPLDSRFGLARGFDVYDDRFSNVDTHTAFVMEERRGGDTVALARRWMAQEANRPFFCWVHVYEPHFPYAPPEPFASRFAGAPYQGEVAATDAALGSLLQPLLEAGSGDRTIVVLTADHGESLGEHGEMTHGIFAYEATLRVPLIVHAPRLWPPRVVADTVRHVDLLPTILDALALPVPAELAGRSLLPLLAGGPAEAEPVYFESLSSAKNRGWAPLFGTVAGGKKYVELPIPELYDLAADPQETRNLAAAEPQTLERLRATLFRLRGHDPGWSGGRESTEAVERLRSLGYLSGSAPAAKTSYKEEDDPKRLIAVDAEVQSIITRYQAGDLRGAMALAQDVLRRHPTLRLARQHLALLHRESGNLPAAVDSLKTVVAQDPADAEVAALLGVYLNEAGRAGETLALLEPYAKRPDPDIDVLTAVGVAFAQTGQPARALQTFERARQVDPSHAMTLVNVATVHLGAREYGPAREALLAALRLNPALARAHNALGVIAAETGRTAEAVEAWKRAVELDPGGYDTLFNLGSLLWKSGRAAEARPYLEQFVRGAPRAFYAADVEKVRQWLASS